MFTFHIAKFRDMPNAEDITWPPGTVNWDLHLWKLRCDWRILNEALVAPIDTNVFAILFEPREFTMFIEKTSIFRTKYYITIMSILYSIYNCAAISFITKQTFHRPSTSYTCLFFTRRAGSICQFRIAINNPYTHWQPRQLTT